MEEESWTTEDEAKFFAEAEAQALRELNAKLMEVQRGTERLRRMVLRAAQERGIRLWP